MLSSVRARSAATLIRASPAVPRRAFTLSAQRLRTATDDPREKQLTAEAERAVQESKKGETSVEVSQAPNRKDVWSRSQKPRSAAMTGPRFEQTDMEAQPKPLAAIELIHRQPVNWVHGRVVACDGGGGPTGHPRIFINLDKPQICECTYCGLPYANEHHKEAIKALDVTPYPLEPQGNPAEVLGEQKPFEQR